MNTFFLALFRPVKAFHALKINDKFPMMSFVIILFLMLVNLILMIPVGEKVLSITVSSMSLPENQLDMMRQVAHKMRYLQVAGSEILFIVMFLFYALLLYLFVRIAKEKLSYKNALQLIIYSYLIATIGDLVNTAILYMRGLDAITNIHELSLTGLNLLTSVEQVGVAFYTFLSCFTPFQGMYVLLLSIGLKIFTEVKYSKALTISLLFWLFTVLIPTVSAYFSQLAVERAGVM
jgi:hypothetical protein